MSKELRLKCSCGHVFDVETLTPCPNCNQPVNVCTDGVLQLYRMGSPVGIAVGYGIYINGQPYGHLGNTQTIRIPLPYGTYNIHCTAGMTRDCKDLTITLSPENKFAYAKARIQPGFWANTIHIEAATEADMPNIE